MVQLFAYLKEVTTLLAPCLWLIHQCWVLLRVNLYGQAQTLSSHRNSFLKCKKMLKIFFKQKVTWNTLSSFNRLKSACCYASCASQRYHSWTCIRVRLPAKFGISSSFVYSFRKLFCFQFHFFLLILIKNFEKIYLHTLAWLSW